MARRDHLSRQRYSRRVGGRVAYFELSSLSFTTLSWGSLALLIRYSNWPSLSGSCLVTSNAPRAASRLKEVGCKNTLRPSLNLCAAVCVEVGGWTKVRMRLTFARTRSDQLERSPIETLNASRLKGWIEGRNALGRRLGELSGCARTKIKSSKIMVGNPGPR
jgi:hypothetical protein